MKALEIEKVELGWVVSSSCYNLCQSCWSVCKAICWYIIVFLKWPQRFMCQSSHLQCELYLGRESLKSGFTGFSLECVILKGIFTDQPFSLFYNEAMRLVVVVSLFVKLFPSHRVIEAMGLSDHGVESTQLRQNNHSLFIS